MLDFLFSRFGNHCGSAPNFFDFPTWYQYIRLEHSPITDRCELPQNLGLNAIPLISIAVVDILLRVAAFAAICYVVYGGVQMVVAQGESDKIKKGRQTIINALIGLVIALIATGLVAFIGRRIGY